MTVFSNKIPNAPLCDTGDIDYRVPHCDTMLQFGVLLNEKSTPEIDRHELNIIEIDDEISRRNRKLLQAFEDMLTYSDLMMSDPGLAGEIASVYALGHAQIEKSKDDRLAMAGAKIVLREAYEGMLRVGGCAGSKKSVLSSLISGSQGSRCGRCPFQTDPLVSRAKEIVRTDKHLVIPRAWQNEPSC